MSTTATTQSPYSLSFGHLLRSEAIKLTTLRSPWWSALIVLVLSVGISAAMAASFAGSPFGTDQASSQIATNVVLMPTTFTVLLAVIIGAMQSSGEYSTGMILSSTTAAPRRIGNVIAKAINVAVFVFLLCLVTFAISAVLTGAILSRINVAMDWSDPWGSWLPLIIGSAAMAVFAVIGVSCGYIFRSPAGAMAVAIAVVFVLPLIPQFFAMLPGAEWIRDLAAYLPTNAFQTVVLGSGDDKVAAAIALGAWAVVPLALAAIIVKRRDA